MNKVIQTIAKYSLPASLLNLAYRLYEYALCDIVYDDNSDNTTFVRRDCVCKNDGIISMFINMHESESYVNNVLTPKLTILTNELRVWNEPSCLVVKTYHLRGPYWYSKKGNMSYVANSRQAIEVELYGTPIAKASVIVICTIFFYCSYYLDGKLSKRARH